MADRAEVLDYAAAHGDQAAAEKFGVKAGTLRSWRSRAKRRARRNASDDGNRQPSPVARFEQQAALIAAWAAAVRDRQPPPCLHCGGADEVSIPAVQRGNVVLRWARRIPCPTCGGRPRPIRVTEWPKEQWAEFMAAAGDLGLGWTQDEWARIRAGEVNPYGQKWTHHDRIYADADGVVWKPARDEEHKLRVQDVREAQRRHR